MHDLWAACLNRLAFGMRQATAGFLNVTIPSSLMNTTRYVVMVNGIAANVAPIRTQNGTMLYIQYSGTQSNVTITADG